MQVPWKVLSYSPSIMMLRVGEARARNALLQSRINWSASWKVRYGYTEPPCHVEFRKTSLTALCEVTWASSISVKL